MYASVFIHAQNGGGGKSVFVQWPLSGGWAVVADIARQAVGFGGRGIDGIKLVAQRGDGNGADRVRAVVQGTGHQFGAEGFLAPVLVGDVGAAIAGHGYGCCVGAQVVVGLVSEGAYKPGVVRIGSGSEVPRSAVVAVEVPGSDAQRPSKSHLKTALAYRIKRSFQEFWTQPADLAEAFLKRWYYWATHSQLEPVIRVAKTIKEHWHGVLRWHTTRVTNGVLEGLNSLIQAAKAKARGYRSSRNLIVMTYLIGGKLDIPLPALTHTK